MTSYALKENQCRNFAPNIFNKNKCQNCFKPRETHLLSDKDLNKATPIYFGWLLLAPIGTDFDNPTHRARKWQRRHFVLFEHGALRYALDDNANTLPQGTINMNKCTDVVQAEVITGQKHSLCIYLPEMKYFIRSESRDDTMGWFEQLIVFPQTVKQDALNKKRFGKKYGITRPVSLAVDDGKNKKTTVAQDGLRSPRVDGSHENVTSPEIPEKRASPREEIKRGRSISRKSTDRKQGTQTSDSYKPLRRAKSLDRDPHEPNDISLDSLNQRKGWLMKRENALKETWTKHWFVLMGTTLKYYEDPAAEEFLQADSEVNLSDVVKVTEVEMSRNYGFSIHTSTEEIVLAAVTSGIRRNWINAIEKSLKTLNQSEPSATDTEKSMPMIVDEKMVETTMLRRAKMRQRRKLGRSRTYDFAELRSAVPADSLKVENESRPAELELHKPVLRTEITLPPKNVKSKETKLEKNGLKSPEVVKRESTTSPKTQAKSEAVKNSSKAILTPQMINHSENHWKKIEFRDPFSSVSTHDYSKMESISSSSAFTACSELKSEFDAMERQMKIHMEDYSDVLDGRNYAAERDGFLKEKEALKGVGVSSKVKMSVNENGGSHKTSHDDVDSENLKALEIAHKFAIEENKRLRDEILQSNSVKEQELSRMRKKIRDLKTELAMANNRSHIEKSILKSEKMDRSLKDKVSELEAEMEDTGQMIDARLSALENPRRKETDDSDEAGSSSSCSSINQMMRQTKEEEKSEVSRTEFNLEISHQRLGESIKMLHNARISPEISVANDTSQNNSATILSLRKKLVEDRKIWSSVKKCLQELRVKVGEIQNSKYKADPHLVFPFLESVLDDTLQMIEKGPISDSQEIAGLEISHDSANKKARLHDPKEKERQTLDKLKLLSEQLKVSFCSKSSSTPSLVRPFNSTLNSDNQCASAGNISQDEREKLFAEQLSHEAMVIAEMATTLERFTTNSDLSSALHSDTQEVFPENVPGKARDETDLLQHAGIVAEKLVLESHLIAELSKLQADSDVRRVGHEVKSLSLPSSGSFGKSTQEGTRRKVMEENASLSLVQAQVNYMLHVYNDRIARLLLDVKEARHRADMFEQKLHELVHACKTRDIELVSQIAVEVDTKASLVQTVEDLPEWRQQVDYGMLHGAQASTSSIDLRAEASFFTKLSRDISCMSSDVSSLVGIGTRILELDMSLSRLLKPSAIGEHASVVAYEAISQAQLLFLCRRIGKDYEEEVTKMKLAVNDQAVHCEALRRKLEEMENGDATKMQELTKKHKQKVEKLMQQLSLVEKARQEMTSDMDQKLNKLAQKQQREMERCEEKHKQETENLRGELEDNETRLQQTLQGHLEEISQWKASLREIKKQHEKQMSDAKLKYEEELNKERMECERRIDSVLSNDAEKMDKTKSEFRKDLEDIMASHEKEIKEISRQKKLDMKHAEEEHKREIENERAEKEKSLRNARKEWEDSLKEKQEQLEALQQSRDTEQQHDVQMNELQSFFEQSFSDFEESNKKQLEEIAEQYQQEVNRLAVEKAREMDEDVTSTKIAIMSMRKHYQEELGKIRTHQTKASESDPELQQQVDDLKRELEALSELYSKKCVEITDNEDSIKAFEERLLVAEKNNEVLKQQNDQLSHKLEEELGEMKTSSLLTKTGDGDVYRLRVELGAKKLQVAILQQQMESLKRQVAMTLQGRGHLRHGDQDLLKTLGYDVMKSKSHPDFMSFEETHKTPGRRSSERRGASKVSLQDI